MSEWLFREPAKAGKAMLSIGLTIFSIFIIGLELFTGCAIIGWSGDRMIAERKKHPGPYWFGITLHVIVGVALPLAIFFCRLADA